MRPSKTSVISLSIVVLMALFQLNQNISEIFADWMIDSPHFRQRHNEQSQRILIEVKSQPSIWSLGKHEDSNILERSIIQEEKPINKNEETKSEPTGALQQTKDSDIVFNSENTTFLTSDTAEDQDTKPLTVKISEKESRGPSAATVQNIEQQLEPKLANKGLRFHLIVTRFVNDTSIIQFNRPNEISYTNSNHLHPRTLESIFYHYPRADVTIHTNFLIDSDFQQFIDAGYSLQTMPLEFEKLAIGTPLEGATRDPKWKVWETSNGWCAGFSELYRLIVIWTLGGVYMDTDMVLTRPLEGLDKAVGFQDPGRIFLNCAIMIFREPGNPFLLKWMGEVVAHFNGGNGAQLLTRVWRGWENRTERDSIVQVQDQPDFYLFYHRNTKHHCFNNSMTGEQRLAYAKALAARAPYAVHMSNKMTWLVKKDLIPGTFCHYLLTRYCVFCDAYPAKPPSYPAIDEGGEHVELP